MRAPRFRRRLVAALLALAAAACAQREAPRHAAPAQERASWLLEPAQLALGDVADLVLAVVTHPGARVAPGEPSASLPGLAVLEREVEPVQQEPARWVHRTRLRIRALEVGRFELPGGVVHAESADGAALEIPYEPLAVEVLSSIGPHPQRRVPYGVRRLTQAPVGAAGAALAFGAGAALALGSVGVALLARRRRDERARRPPEAPPHTPPPWETARLALAAADARLASDPRAALDAASQALRRYAAARYGADVLARTSEELAATTPPFLMTTRWRAFVALLSALDAARFPPSSPDPAGAPRAASLLSEARAFVEMGVPQEARR